LKHRALQTDEIKGIVEYFRTGAENAKTAGFDGITTAEQIYIIAAFALTRRASTSRF
jgi:2,4-dienoyl-CoA reductase-like NADH-dependent reductase (Old Yellow Enzyme family)